MEKTTKTSQAQLKASKKWAEKNKARRTYISMKGTTKNFIRTKATKEDLDEIIQLAMEYKGKLS